MVILNTTGHRALVLESYHTGLECTEPTSGDNRVWVCGTRCGSRAPLVARLQQSDLANKLGALLGAFCGCLSPSGLLSQKAMDGVAYKQQTFISHSSGGYQATVKVLADLVFTGGPLPG